MKFNINLPKTIHITIIILFYLIIESFLPINYQPSSKLCIFCIDIYRATVSANGFMGFYRILRCNPWTKGGYDPVL